MTEVKKRSTGFESSLSSLDWLHTINVAPGSIPAPGKPGVKPEINNNSSKLTTVRGSSRSSQSSDEFEQDETSQESLRGPVNGTSVAQKDGKPPYSYANLITFAVNSTPRKMMTLCDIYQWIQDNFSYFKDAGNGWKNSIRHNLSLNKCFVKIPRNKDDPGKGSYWAIDHNPIEGQFGKKRRNPYSPEGSFSSGSSLGSPAYSLHGSAPGSQIRLHGSLPASEMGASFVRDNPMLTDLSASFKKLYHEVFENPQGIGNQILDGTGNSFSISQFLKSHNFQTGAGSMPPASSPNSCVSSATGVQFHQQQHQFPSTQPANSNYHEHLDSASPNTQVQTNVSLTGSNFEWLNNIDNLKESLRLASTNNFKLDEVDMTQFQDLLENMRQLDQTNYSINAEQFAHLAPSLEAFFEQTGVLRQSSSQSAADFRTTDLRIRGVGSDGQLGYQQSSSLSGPMMQQQTQQSLLPSVSTMSALPPHMQALKSSPRQAVVVRREPQAADISTSTASQHGPEDDNPFGIDWEKML
ncbi:forkhead box protein J3-like [Watersipora subatra]|uniref:forkhead box protein J3-like n=1 Tax=Watersipora subatra TaxID=2589382 RepID=UPI00355BABA7